MHTNFDILNALFYLKLMQLLCMKLAKDNGARMSLFSIRFWSLVRINSFVKYSMNTKTSPVMILKKLSSVNSAARLKMDF